MRSSTRRVIGGLGIVTALGAAYFVGRGQGTAKVSREERTAVATLPGEEIDVGERTAALERELARLRREVRDNAARWSEKAAADTGEAQAGDAEPRGAAAEPLDIPSAEEEEKIIGERFAGFARRHQSDPVDPTWAPRAEAHLQEGLAAIEKEAGIKVLETECKTEVCRAKVEWENYELAKQSGATLAQVTLPGLPCGQSIWFEEPPERAARYSTYVYLDCQGMRAGLD